MNASSGKTLGIILVVLLVLMIAWPLKYVLFAPVGLFDSIFHGGHGLHLDHSGWWPWVGFVGFFGLAALALWIAVIVWVYKDAEKRGMNGALWALLVFFLHLIGLLIFVLVRGDHPVRSGGPQAAAAPPVLPEMRQARRPVPFLLPGLRRASPAPLSQVRQGRPGRLAGLPELRRKALNSPERARRLSGPASARAWPGRCASRQAR